MFASFFLNTRSAASIFITHRQRSRKHLRPGVWSPGSLRREAARREATRAARGLTSGFSSERTGRPYAWSQMLATALAVRGEDPAALRAVPPASVARLLAAQRDPAEWRSGTGREPSATVVSKASRQRR